MQESIGAIAIELCLLFCLFTFTFLLGKWWPVTESNRRRHNCLCLFVILPDMTSALDKCVPGGAIRSASSARGPRDIAQMPNLCS
jgi:hypothetical protein